MQGEPLPQQPEGESSVPLDAAEAVRQTTVRVLSERIELVGIDRSGAYEHYSFWLSKGFPIRSYELSILDFVKRRLPDLRSYHEIGSGLGTVPFMLAYEGFTAVGVERDDRRHLTSTTILRELTAQYPHMENNCRLVGAEFPDAVLDLDVSDSLAILTDFVSTQDPSAYVRLCRELAGYRYVLMDLQRFCVKRETAEEQERLVEELAKYGLVPCSGGFDCGSEGSYRLFEGKPTEGHRKASAKAELRKGTLLATAPSKPGGATALAPRQALQLVPGTDLKPVAGGQLPLQATPVEVPSTLRAAPLPQMPQRARRARFGGWLGVSALLVIGIPTILAIVYYGFVASSQYVTTFQFAVRGPSQASGRTMSTAMTGTTAMSPDAFVVTDYINSPQAIADVEGRIELRSVFSKPGIDFWSRLPEHDVSAEELNAYWARMVLAHFDIVSGNVSVSVRAFSPQDSLALAETLIATSDEMFRRLNTQAQEDIVKLANDNLNRAQQQLVAAREQLLTFREKSGLVDADREAAAGVAIVDDLRKQLAGLQAQQTAIRTVSPNSPNLTSLNSQIASLEAKIRQESQLGTSQVKAISPEALRGFQSLDAERQFAEKVYGEALSLRSQAFIMAQNQQSYLALFVKPKLPQTSLYPDRVKSIFVVVLAAAAAWFLGMLVVYAVRDHLA
ncbi:hypothetical protein [Reyranella soli]|uniref:Uncharacterized protein n=1 Tax=Reyranella soli TaxID=1230389 RepID=A0A512NI43_9HYPH|nr:hypothetical protein [Reyranella soli]GEP58624.1 hypothetical protein RSO01_57900 [Reyranella soli]